MRDFVDLMISLGFIIQITVPPYRALATGDKTSLIDHNLTNLDGDCKCGVILPKPSDRHAIASVCEEHACENKSLLGSGKLSSASVENVFQSSET